MSQPAWSEDWFDTATPLGVASWRGVDAQYIVATMRLVDNLREQAILEKVLQNAQSGLAGPPRSRSARLYAPQHELLTAPFRHRSPHASRFRPAGAAGVWYGAQTLHAAAAEVAYWRWRFLSASAGLRDKALLTEHLFFQAQVGGLAIDLGLPPWVELREAWTRDRDYSQTQALATDSIARGVQWLRYESVRHPGGRCAAVFDVLALSLDDPFPQQTWHCKTTLDSVMLQHDADRFEWRF